MLDSYMEKQSLFYNYMVNSLKNGKLSHAYLIDLNGVSYGDDLVNCLVKFILCNGVYNKRIYELIDDNSYSNYYIINSENVIKKEQILNLQEEFSYKSIDNNRKLYLIKDASLLNDSSANSLLKFLEEPNDDIIALLVTNNIKDVKETIVSRCQVINLINNEKFDYKSLFDYYDSDNAEISFDQYVDHEYNYFLDFYYNLEKLGYLVLKDKNIYDNCIHFSQLLKFGLYLYFDLINAILYRERDRFVLKEERESFFLSHNNYDSILKKLDLLNEFLSLLKNNVNKNLLFDNFIVNFGGVNCD